MLFNGQVLAIVVPNAVSERIADHITRKIVSSRLTSYGVEPRFLKVGKAWFDSVSDGERQEHIAATAEYTVQTRKLCAPFPVPTDILKLDLDLLWPSGTINQRIGGKPIYYGLPRALPPGGAVQCHFDSIHEDSPGASGIERIRKQISVNFHVQPAESGGELALWSLNLPAEDLLKFRDPPSPYALDEKRLGPPALVVTPEPRCLVLFNAMEPHAVRQVKGSRPRVSFSAFLGYRGPGQALTLWS